MNPVLSLYRRLPARRMLLSACVVAPFIMGAGAQAYPGVVVSNTPLPESLVSEVYASPVQAPEISAQTVIGQVMQNRGIQTEVGRRVEAVAQDYTALQSTISGLSSQLLNLENQGRLLAADYYTHVATINTQLQSGTTPANPRLVERLGQAQQSLDTLNQNAAALNDLAVQIQGTSSSVTYLLDAARSLYSVPGALEEDHARLSQIEDMINSLTVVMDRLLNNANDDVTRTSAYLTAERNNLRAISLAVTEGEFLGKSLSSRPFANAPAFGASQGTQLTAVAPAGSPKPQGSGQLMKITFDKSNVEYEQPLYMAVNDVLERNPEARFEVVAVHPDRGNVAQQAIESSRSKRNAETVLRSLYQLGVGPEKVQVSHAASGDAPASEVHVFVR